MSNPAEVVVWSVVLILAVLLVASQVRPAPAPLPRDPKPVRKVEPIQITPGEYWLQWMGNAQPAHFFPNGEYSWSHSFTGTWTWDEANRVLSVRERYGDGDYSWWQAKLDAAGRGVTTGEVSGAKVRLTPKPTP